MRFPLLRKLMAAVAGAGFGGSGGAALRGVPIPLLLTQDSSTTDANNFNTASIAPVNGRPCFMWVSSHNASGPNEAACTGWTKVETKTYGATNVRRETLLKADSTPSGVQNITFGGQVQTAACWALAQVQDAAPIATAVVQAPTPTSTNSNTTLASPTLAALEYSGNIMLVGVSHSVDEDITGDADFTTLASQHKAANAVTLHVAWARGATTNDTTFSSGAAGAISIEVKAA